MYARYRRKDNSEGVVLFTVDNFISLDNIRQFLSQQPFYGTGRKKNDAIWKVDFPSQSFIFYSYLLSNRRFPTFNEFVEEILKHRDFTVTDESIIVDCRGKHNVISRYDLETRLWRTYPAFFRDMSAFFKCAEDVRCIRANMSTTMDIKEKTDVRAQFIGTDGREHIASIDVKANNPNSPIHKGSFNSNPEVILVDLGVNASFREVVGDYYILNQSAVDYIVWQAERRG